MTLHQLRLAVGDPAFFKILQQWAKSRGGGNGTTKQFIGLAEQISGQDLDALSRPGCTTRSSRPSRRRCCARPLGRSTSVMPRSPPRASTSAMATE